MEEANIPIEENVIKESVSKKKSHTEKIRENPWILSTVVLGVLTLVLILPSLGITGGAISEKNVGNLALNFFNTQLSNTAGDLVSVEKTSGVYKITFSVEGQEVPLYFTEDGNWIQQGSDLVPIVSDSKETSSSTTTQQAEVPKSDKPEVELFIWSYCPYGVQAQVPYAEVASLLGDVADFKVDLYYDGHGEHETQQNKIQACIQKLYPDKYWDYATSFVENIYPDCGSSKDVQCNEDKSIDLMKSLGISSTKVMSCVKDEGEDLVTAYSSRAQELGVTGSPTLVINGVKVSVSRDAESFKSAVCEAFNNAPEECSTVLSSTSGTASGNC